MVAGDGSPWPATVFEQVHPTLGDPVRRFAVAQLGEVRGLKVWDLYAGIGETDALLARRQGPRSRVLSWIRARWRWRAGGGGTGPPHRGRR